MILYIIVSLYLIIGQIIAFRLFKEEEAELDWQTILMMGLVVLGWPIIVWIDYNLKGK